MERPKTKKSMIYGFSSRGEPLFMDLNIPEVCRKYKKIMEHVWKCYFYGYERFENRRCSIRWNIFGKDRHRHMMKNRLTNSWKS